MTKKEIDFLELVDHFGYKLRFDKNKEGPTGNSYVFCEDERYTNIGINDRYHSFTNYKQEYRNTIKDLNIRVEGVDYTTNFDEKVATIEYTCATKEELHIFLCHLHRKMRELKLERILNG